MEQVEKKWRAEMRREKSRKKQQRVRVGRKKEQRSKCDEMLVKLENREAIQREREWKSALHCNDLIFCCVTLKVDQHPPRQALPPPTA